eukprot:scaffold88363_cov42-Phaeocystis_antarctica.AAC.1
MVVATRRMHSPGKKVGRRQATPAPLPAWVDRVPTSMPRPPLRNGRATSSGSPTTALRAPTLAWASAP